jgi:hypothetical protein
MMQMMADDVSPSYAFFVTAKFTRRVGFIICNALHHLQRSVTLETPEFRSRPIDPTDEKAFPANHTAFPFPQCVPNRPSENDHTPSDLVVECGAAH